MYEPVVTWDGKKTGSLQSEFEILHWDGPGWYAGQWSDYHQREVTLRLESSDVMQASKEARMRGLGTARYLGAAPA